ncbi:MAG: AMP-binding protein, partial [Balneolaceae bacterium]
MPTTVPFETIADLYIYLVRKYKNSSKTAFGYKSSEESGYKTVTWDETERDVEAMAGFLLEKGTKPGDRIAILSENRYEWAVIDLAVQRIGAVNVALYASLPADQCEFILRDSGAQLFFVSTGIQLRKAVEVFGRCSDLTHVIAFDEPKKAELADRDYVTLYERALADGRAVHERHRKTLRLRERDIQPESLSTLIYTSGTTGAPKGAMLTHRNIVSNVKAAHEAIHIDANDRCLSFLPLSHSFERTGGYYAMLAGGAEIYYAQSVDTVAKNMLECSPTIVVSVPRLFEKIYNLVTKRVEEGSAVKKAIFNWGMTIGRRYSEGERGLVSLQKKLADKLVFDKIKQRTGGRIRFFVSGGAPLPAEIGTFFMSAGLNILEGYGLTETSPVITCNRYGDERMGSVG